MHPPHSITHFISFLNLIQPISKCLEKFIIDNFELSSIKKGKTLLMEGTDSNVMWYIIDGVLRTYLPLQSKEDYYETTTRIMTKEEFVVSVRSFFGGEPSYENIETLTDCTLIKITKFTWNLMHKEFPEVNYHSRILTQEYAGQMFFREYLLRHKSAEQRFNLAMKHFAHLFDLVPEKYLASFINVDNSNFNKIKNGKYNVNGGG